MSLSLTAADDSSAVDVLVRTATSADHAAIRALLRAAYGHYAVTLPREMFCRYLCDLLDLDAHQRHGTLLVAERDDAVVGFVAFYADVRGQGLGLPPGWSGGRGLAVDPAARGLGVAQRLIAACEELARDTGATVFGFHTAIFMSAAVRLYEHLGFRRAPEFDQDMAHAYGVPEAAPIKLLAYRRDVAPASSFPG